MSIMSRRTRRRELKIENPPPTFMPRLMEWPFRRKKQPVGPWDEEPSEHER